MHTLTRSIDHATIAERVRALQATDQARWGLMNAGEMLCHLRGALRMAMGEIPAAPIDLPMPRTLLKSRALWVPLPWHKSFRTVPSLERGTPTMQSGVFEEDRAEVLADLERFCRPEQARVDHPMFGPMSFEDWMRWGYLHADHHLRQFSR